MRISMTQRSLSAGLSALILVLAGCGESGPADPESGLRQIRINYPTLSAGSWHLFVTKEGGYYEKYGLDTELVFGLHPQGVALLVSGEGQMANYSMEQALIAASRDGSFRLIGSALNKGTFALMASPEISSVEELAGRRFGISQIGDAPYNYSVALISQFGLTSRDIEWTPVGTGAAGRAAALLAGRVDATLLTAPTYFSLEEEGFNKLADMSEFDDIYASSAYLVTDDELEEHPELAEQLIKAHAEGIARFYADREFAIDAYLVYDPQATREDLERVYAGYMANDLFERVPYVLRGAVESILAQADTAANPQLETFDFSTVIDRTTIDRLVDEGFFEELFGPGIVEEQERKAALAYR